MRNSKTNELVLTGLFTAIIIIMAFTPLGYIPLVVINATIIHIPVILGSLFWFASSTMPGTTMPAITIQITATDIIINLKLSFFISSFKSY